MTLLEYLDSTRSVKFQWGEHDCAMFAAKRWDQMRGTNLADRVRAYGVRSAKDYRRIQRAGKSLQSLVTEVIGEPVKCQPVEDDVVLVRTSRGAVLGIACPPVVMCAAEVGFEPVPLSCAELVWRGA